MKSKYTIGTKVRIINPEFFVRCGYPETVDSARDKLIDWFKENHNDNLPSFLEQLFPFLRDGIITSWIERENFEIIDE